MTDTKLLNWMHNYQIDVNHYDNTVTVSLYNEDDDLPLIEQSGLTLRETLKSVYEKHQAIKNKVPRNV